jgi:transmembrane sensor
MQDLFQDEFFIKMVNNPDEETTHYWQRWLKLNPDRRKEFELAKQTIQSIRYKNVRNLSASDYDRIFNEIRSFKKKHDEKESLIDLSKKAKLLPIVWKAAAVILFLISASFGVRYLFFSEGSTTELATVEQIEKFVPLGAKQTIRLGDGTVVRLNSGSKLKYPVQFSEGRRDVELVGEAFFEVAGDENRPFTISTGEIRTQVLGTSFNVRYHTEEDNVQVALVSGKVKISDLLGNEMLLEPSEMAIYSSGNKTIKKKNFDEKLVTSWKDNILIFEKASISEVVDHLERWYGVNIDLQLKTPIVGMYSGEYKDKSLDIVLEGIGYASGFQYEIDGMNVKIKN